MANHELHLPPLPVGEGESDLLSIFQSDAALMSVRSAKELLTTFKTLLSYEHPRLFALANVLNRFGIVDMADIKAYKSFLLESGYLCMSENAMYSLGQNFDRLTPEMFVYRLTPEIDAVVVNQISVVPDAPAAVEPASLTDALPPAAASTRIRPETLEKYARLLDVLRSTLSQSAYVKTSIHQLTQQAGSNPIIGSALVDAGYLLRHGLKYKLGPSFGSLTEHECARLVNAYYAEVKAKTQATKCEIATKAISETGFTTPPAPDNLPTTTTLPEQQPVPRIDRPGPVPAPDDVLLLPGQRFAVIFLENCQTFDDEGGALDYAQRSVMNDSHKSALIVPLSDVKAIVRTTKLVTL